MSACRLGVTEKKIDCIRQAGIEGLKTALAIKRLDAESLRHCHSGKSLVRALDPLALLLAFGLVLGGEVLPLAASVDPAIHHEHRLAIFENCLDPWPRLSLLWLGFYG